MLVNYSFLPNPHRYDRTATHVFRQAAAAVLGFMWRRSETPVRRNTTTPAEPQLGNLLLRVIYQYMHTSQSPARLYLNTVDRMHLEMTLLQSKLFTFLAFKRVK